jgi:hypothetical protein
VPELHGALADANPKSRRPPLGQSLIPVYQTEKAEEGNAAQYPRCKDDEDRNLHEGSLANIRRSTSPPACFM